MIYISTAMYSEAKPFIDYLGLKKDIKSTKFQIFKNEEVAVIITKIGMISAAIATTFLLTEKKAIENDVYINIGVCASKNRDIKEGEIILCNKITNHTSKKTFYTDIIFKHPFKEKSLETFPIPVTEDIKEEINGDLIDMEGAADYEAASRFLPPHQIYCIKIVCDFLHPYNVTAEKVEELVQNQINNLVEWIKKRKSAYEKQDDILSVQEYQSIKQIKNNLKITIAMYYQFIQFAKQYKLRNQNINEMLKQFENIKCKSKKEGKIYFAKIKNKLIAV